MTMNFLLAGISALNMLEGSMNEGILRWLWRR